MRLLTGIEGRQAKDSGRVPGGAGWYGGFASAQDKPPCGIRRTSSFNSEILLLRACRAESAPLPKSCWDMTNLEGVMKDVTAELLAIGFVLYSLIALLSLERNRDSTSSPSISNQEKISELGLRVVFQFRP